MRKLVESGELRAFRVGKLWRIRAEAVDEFEARPAVPTPLPRPAAKEDRNLALTRLRLRNLRRLKGSSSA
ncbi:excisionase family DNA-binding protein [Methylobacterium hispanicum]|uniref:excisionase family DNA-binding protein n=1 Tax=Methylobacterium hispanicum TaxID=270350 RepID=UPI002F33DEC6